MMWADKTVAYPILHQICFPEIYPLCGSLGFLTPYLEESENLQRATDTWNDTVCLLSCYSTKHRRVILCEYQQELSELSSSSAIALTLPHMNAKEAITGLTVCPSNHTVHEFLACDSLSHCWALLPQSFGHSPESWDIPSAHTCPVTMTSLPPSYGCQRGGQRVPYSLVCDHRQDCVDNSDEDFCVHQPCPPGHVHCSTDKQCYNSAKRCDGNVDCVNGDDEGICMHRYLNPTRHYSVTILPPPPPPAVVNFITGFYTIYPLNQPHGVSEHSKCPETHYQCPKGYCLPVFTRCNGVYDCPEKQDEAGCEHYQCPGHYRCRRSSICLHPLHVCDGLSQCPQSDDELLCDQQCPSVCTCHGQAFTCHNCFSADQFPDLRYLKASGSRMKMEHVTLNLMLVYLSLASCQVFALGNSSLPNIVTLDLSNNHITSLTNGLQGMLNLKTLFLSDNPLSRFLYDGISQQNDADGSLYIEYPHIEILHLSAIDLPTISGRLAKLFPNVQLLNMSGCGTHRVTDKGLQLMTQLHTLDMRGCPMDDIQENVLKDLTQLRMVYGNNYKLCCEAGSLERFNLNNCIAPQDEISSCSDLLRSNVYRSVLVLFASQSLLGNLVSGVFHLMTIKTGVSAGFSVFIIHLCASDFLMGLYLSIIGVADRLYQNTYTWADVSWRHSLACQIAGFISLLSSELSALICLITLERFLVVRFPLSFLHFKGIHAHLATASCWTIGITLAVAPFSPNHAHWDFYSQTGICTPLPVTRNHLMGNITRLESLLC